MASLIFKVSELDEESIECLLSDFNNAELTVQDLSLHNITQADLAFLNFHYHELLPRSLDVQTNRTVL